MQLHCTPRSHFARKVRLLAAALELPLDLVDAGNVGSGDPAAFGPHPLMKVPTLVDGEVVLFESDHIAAHLVRRFDPDDRYAVLTTNPDLLNARAVLNGVMSNEVELILAARSGIDVNGPARYWKLRDGIDAGLSWLEARADLVPAEPSYLGFHLVAAWEHLVLFDVVALGFPRLAEKARVLGDIPFVAASRPPAL